MLESIKVNKERNYQKALKLHNDGLFTNALAFYFRALNAAEIINDLEAQILIKKGIMLCYAAKYEYDEVLAYNDDLISNYDLEMDLREKILATRALALSRKGQYRKAEAILKDILNSEFLQVRYLAANDLGILYYFLDSFSENTYLEQALETLQTAYDCATSLDQRAMFRAASNLGLVYLKKGEVQAALKYFAESLEKAETEYATFQTYNELGRAYAALGDLEKSDEYFEKVSKYALENEKFLTLTYNIYYRGLVQIQLGKINSAYNYLYTALYGFLEHKHYSEVLAINKELVQLFKDINPERSKYFENEYHHYYNYIDPLGEE